MRYELQDGEWDCYLGLDGRLVREGGIWARTKCLERKSKSSRKIILPVKGCVGSSVQIVRGGLPLCKDSLKLENC